MASRSSSSTSLRAGLAFLKQSFLSEHQDFTRGSIRRAVFLLAIPMILEMMMESIFAVVDIFFVGRIGKEAVATVGLTESVLTLVYSIAIGLSMAATAVVARRTGEKDIPRASRAGAQSILIALFLTALVSVAGMLLAPDILRAMGGHGELVRTGSSYTRIIFGGSIVIMLLFLINGIFRGAGNPAMAMWSLWLANGCNIILCPILIHFFGLPGAAMATTTGRGIGVCYQLYHLFKGKGLIRLRLSYFVPDWKGIRAISNIAWAGTMQFAIGSASWIFLARIIASFDDVAIAGYQVAIRVLIFFLLPAWGLSNAAATLVGQNLGAQQPERAEQSVWKTAKYNAILMAGVSALLLLGSGAIIGFLNKDAAVEKIAIEALQIISLGYIFYGVGMVMTSALNGAGDTRTPTYINLFGFWALQIPLAYFLSIRLKMGPRGVFLAILIAESAITVAAIVLFKRGRWKKVKV